MGKSVSLRDLVDQIGWQLSEGAFYLDRESGEVIPLIPGMDDSEEWSELIEEDPGERFLALPDQSDFDELEWMREFALGLPDGRAGNQLIDATNRSHPYRRFKDMARELGVIDDWQKFRDAQLRDVAIEWCVENDVE